MDEVAELTMKWKHIQEIGVEPEWKRFSTFLRWCMSSGYEEKASLRRKNYSKPYGPENCYWQPYANNHNPDGSAEHQFIRKWNKTVNVFRRLASLTPFPE